MITAPYERIYITIKHACGHDAAKAVFRTPETENDPRVQGSAEKCKLCQQEAKDDTQKAHDPGKSYYMIDGHRWLVYKAEGYWHARRYDPEQKKTIRKYFGKDDPGPELEEAL